MFFIPDSTDPSHDSDHGSRSSSDKRPGFGDSHWAEAFGLQPGFDLVSRGVIGDADGRAATAAGGNLEPLLSTAAQSQPVHQLVLDLLHVGFPACGEKEDQRRNTRPNINGSRLLPENQLSAEFRWLLEQKPSLGPLKSVSGLTVGGGRSLVAVVPHGDAAVVA